MFAGGDDVFYGYPGQDIVMNITATVLLAFGMSMDAFDNDFHLDLYINETLK